MQTCNGWILGSPLQSPRQKTKIDANNDGMDVGGRPTSTPAAGTGAVAGGGGGGGGPGGQQEIGGGGGGGNGGAAEEMDQDGSDVGSLSGRVYFLTLSTA